MVPKKQERKTRLWKNLRRWKRLWEPKQMHKKRRNKSHKNKNLKRR